MNTLFTIGALPVTAYALGMALSLMACAVLTLVCFHRAGLPRVLAERFLLLALPLGYVLARLSYVLLRLPYFLERGDGMALRLWQGGYTLWGVLAALVLAGLITAKGHRASFGKTMDALAAPSLLLLALGRFCEGLAGMGFGQEATAAVSFFPFAVGNEWGEWRWTIFMLEGVAALVFLVIVIKHKGKAGDRFLLVLVLFCAFQILFESLREDEVISFGFVRAGQLLCAITLFALMACGLFRRGGLKGKKIVSFIAYFLLIGVIVGMEFAIDKTNWPILLIYGLVLLSCMGLALVTGRALGLGREQA